MFAERGFCQNLTAKGEKNHNVSDSKLQEHKTQFNILVSS